MLYGRLAERKLERAVEINSATIESRLNRAILKATENITAEAEEALADAGQLIELEDEIMEAAQTRGQDITFIERRIVQSAANRLDVLERVYQQVPAQARPAIEDAMTSSVNKYDRVIESIIRKNATGEATDNVSGMERLREELQERLQVMSENVTRERVQAEVNERVRATDQEQLTDNQTAAQVGEETGERLRMQTETQSSENRTAENKGNK